MLASQSNLFLLSAPIFFAVVALEAVLLWRSGKTYSWREGLASFVVGVGYKISGVLAAGITGVVSLAVWQVRLFEVPLDTVWGLVALFFAVEFAYYWFHRLSHEIRWMWASHAVHHSPNHLNVLAAFRLSWTGVISGGFLVFMPLVWLGFHPAAVGGMLALNLLYQSWVHTDLIPKLGVLEYVLNTPSNHRVHHASNEDYLDRNYGGVLIVFDRLFGTYVEERANEPCRYGLVHPLLSNNPLRIAFHEWIAMARDIVNARRWSHIPRYLFGRPGWKPAAAAEAPATASTLDTVPQKA